MDQFSQRGEPPSTGGSNLAGVCEGFSKSTKMAQKLKYSKELTDDELRATCVREDHPLASDPKTTTTNGASNSNVASREASRWLQDFSSEGQGGYLLTQLDQSAVAGQMLRHLSVLSEVLGASKHTRAHSTAFNGVSSQHEAIEALPTVPKLSSLMKVDEPEVVLRSTSEWGHEEVEGILACPEEEASLFLARNPQVSLAETSSTRGSPSPSTLASDGSRGRDGGVARHDANLTELEAKNGSDAEKSRAGRGAVASLSKSSEDVGSFVLDECEVLRAKPNPTFSVKSSSTPDRASPYDSSSVTLSRRPSLKQDRSGQPYSPQRRKKQRDDVQQSHLQDDHHHQRVQEKLSRVDGKEGVGAVSVLTCSEDGVVRCQACGFELAPVVCRVPICPVSHEDLVRVSLPLKILRARLKSWGRAFAFLTLLLMVKSALSAKGLPAWLPSANSNSSWLARRIPATPPEVSEDLLRSMKSFYQFFVGLCLLGMMLISWQLHRQWNSLTDLFCQIDHLSDAANARADGNRSSDLKKEVFSSIRADLGLASDGSLVLVSSSAFPTAAVCDPDGEKFLTTKAWRAKLLSERAPDLVSAAIARHQATFASHQQEASSKSAGPLSVVAASTKLVDRFDGSSALAPFFGSINDMTRAISGPLSRLQLVEKAEVLGKNRECSSEHQGNDPAGDGVTLAPNEHHLQLSSPSLRGCGKSVSGKLPRFPASATLKQTLEALESVAEPSTPLPLSFTWADRPFCARFVLDKLTKEKVRKALSDSETEVLGKSELEDANGVCRNRDEEAVLLCGVLLPAGLLTINASPPGAVDPAHIHWFETKLFRGTIVIRAKGLPSERWTSYFDGKKREMQVLIQGQFKKRLPISSVLCGVYRDKPFGRLPPAFLVKAAMYIYEKLNPATQDDATATHPYILTPLIATPQAVNICDSWEKAPASDAHIVPEDTKLLGSDFAKDHTLSSTPSLRKRYFKDYRNLKSYEFDPKLIYTFDFYQHLFSLKTFKYNIGFTALDIKPHLDGEPPESMAFVNPKADSLFYVDQPPGATASLASTAENEYLWRVQLWHEDMLCC